MTLNEGWGFALTYTGSAACGVVLDQPRSTKGGASPSPTLGVQAAAGDTPFSLNEGWGFALTYTPSECSPPTPARSLNEGWGFALTYTPNCYCDTQTTRPAQRRVGLRPHLHGLKLDAGVEFFSALNEGWGFALTYTPLS